MARIAVVGDNLPQDCAEALATLGVRVVRLPAFDQLDMPVKTHPDMLLRCIGTDLITSAAYFALAGATLSDLAEESGLHLVLSELAPRSPYPQDIVYNALVIGGYLFGNLPYLAPELLYAAKKAGLCPVRVRQGYTACSTAKVTENALITADKGMATAAWQNGIDALLISPGHIRLFGYPYGFIGGASGLLETRLCFLGDITAHPDFPAIASFCHAYGIMPYSLSSAPLHDYGGILSISSDTGL